MKDYPIIWSFEGKKNSKRWKSFLQLLYMLGEPKNKKVTHTQTLRQNSNEQQREKTSASKKQKRASEKKRTQRLKEVSAIGLYV